MREPLKERVMTRDWDNLTEKCKAAMRLAKTNPGRYGGRYVAWDESKGDWVILGDDDPEIYEHCPELDIFAQCTPTKVHAIGRVRNILSEDGTVDFGDDT